MMMSLPRIVTLAPSGLSDPGVVVAGCRSGALGILDFGFRFDAEAAREAAVRAARYVGGRRFGLRLPASELGDAILDRLPGELDVFVAVEGGFGRDAWAAARATLRRAGGGAVAMAEVTSLAAAEAAAAAGFDALILAGHEAGGRGSDSSSFILLQGVAARVAVPVWVRGGIGLRSAAACLAAGAAGVVLDGALLLARESALDPAVRARIGRWDGGETQVIGRAAGVAEALRVHAAPGSAVLARLGSAAEQGGDAWRRAVRDEVGW
ncbi:MAG: hypothetical protein QOD62_1457, partial [Actinomycetota bacterium]|nr:hypothetical protein [Actinomycetota bacterium]